MAKKHVSIVLIGFFLLSCLVGVFSPSTVWAGEKKRIGVVDFDNASQVSDRAMGRGISDILVNELVKNKSYQVIEREQLAQMMREKKLGIDGFSTGPSQYVKFEGLDYLVVGKIVEAGAQQVNLFGLATQTKVKVVLSVRMIDANSGNILWAEQAEGAVNLGSLNDNSGRTIFAEGQSNSAFSEAARKAVTKVVDKINQVNPLEGFVVQCSGKKVYIDLGREQGVQAGQSYTIFREGNVITHPVTGRILGAEKHDVATIKIISVENDMAIGEVQGSAFGLQAGDKVRKK
ncbi:CsgG/HfaB family protein [Sporomusa malonica]|uniref:Curli biogenesis system outer membrane secretion channel CsgG n=1 Tax=Sporomusa malonica TaxID=112901 RepID=A0A1W2DDX9_9FIRM|nr:CsgG/HfaB family protein [Sporomusa malonica]SMC95715.1 Curli biogenesis system outer membrane secretion channel CsgG [Sporomusa malonica]